MDEKKGVVKGVLTQYIGPWKRLVAYLSKKLDAVAAGWPPCLKIITAVARIQISWLWGRNYMSLTCMPLKGCSNNPPDQWISNAHLTHYQGLLLNLPEFCSRYQQP